MFEDLEELIRNKENELVEFKDHKILENPHKLIKEMMALANNEGGTVLIGLTDNGNFSGLSINRKDEEKIMHLIRDICEPPFNPRFIIRENIKINENTGNLYQIIVPRRPLGLPCAFVKNGNRLFFIRTGTTVRPMTNDELKRIYTELPEEKEILDDINKFEEYENFDTTKPYYDINIFPKISHGKVFELDKEFEKKVTSLRPSCLRYSVVEPRQNCFMFVYKSTDESIEHAQITDEGNMNYREIISKPMEGCVHISRTIRLSGEIISFARYVYEKSRLFCHPFIFRLNLNNIKGRKLVTDPNRMLFDDYFYNKNTLTIERQIFFDENFNFVETIQSILTEFCRSFGFSMEENIANEHTVSVLKKIHDLKIDNLLTKTV